MRSKFGTAKPMKSLLRSDHFFSFSSSFLSLFFSSFASSFFSSPPASPLESLC